MNRKKGRRRLGKIPSGRACREMADKANQAARTLSEISELCEETGGQTCNAIITPAFPFDRSLDEMPARLRNWSLSIRASCPKVGD